MNLMEYEEKICWLMGFLILHNWLLGNVLTFRGKYRLQTQTGLFPSLTFLDSICLHLLAKETVA